MRAVLLLITLLSGSAVGTAVANAGFNGVDLTVGSTYTIDYEITLSALGTLTISNAIYSGSVVGSTPLADDITTASGTLVTTNFDRSLSAGVIPEQLRLPA